MRASRAAAAAALVVAAALVAAARAAAGGSSAGAFPDGAALAHPADVGELMAFAATGNGCTRWATRTGEVGCAGDALGALARLTGAGGATAAAEKAEAAARAAGTGVIAVVSAEEFFAAGAGSKGASASLVSMLADSGRGMEGVVGVLIEADSAASGAYSPAAAAPQGALAHEGQSASYVWNPAGDGALEMRLEVPVIQMTPHDTTEVLRRAAWNEHERAFEPPLYQASFSSDARTDGTSGTEDALGQRQCVPVGGHSIVAVTGGAEAQHATERSPVVLLAASMDARSFFYTQVDTGAGPRSGVVAMLAAADALARACAAVGKPGCPVEALGGARVAMAALDAEAWGHLGARSLGRALRGGAQLGLVEEDVHALLEVGSVGTSQTQAGGELFAHCSLSECSAATMASPAAAELLKALNETDVRDSSAPADAGFPPGVAMAMAHDDGHWLHRGAVLSGWDTRLPVNYMSQRDVLASYSEPDFKALVAKAATAAARGTCAAAAVAGGAGGEIDCKSLVADDAYVSALVDCLVAAHPGIQCELATKRVWGGNSATASRYSQQQSWPDAAPDMKRRGHALVYDLLATTVSTTPSASVEGKRCNWTDPSGRHLQAQSDSSCPLPSQVCASAAQCAPGEGGALTCSNGTCVDAAVAYAPALSAAYEWDAERSRWLVNASAVRPDEGLFCETYWSVDPFALQVVLVQGSSWLALGCGLGVTAAATVAALYMPRLLASRAAARITRRLHML